MWGLWTCRRTAPAAPVRAGAASAQQRVRLVRASGQMPRLASRSNSRCELAPATAAPPNGRQSGAATPGPRAQSLTVVPTSSRGRSSSEDRSERRLMPFLRGQRPNRTIPGKGQGRAGQRVAWPSAETEILITPPARRCLPEHDGNNNPDPAAASATPQTLSDQPGSRPCHRPGTPGSFRTASGTDAKRRSRCVPAARCSPSTSAAACRRPSPAPNGMTGRAIRQPPREVWNEIGDAEESTAVTRGGRVRDAGQSGSFRPSHRRARQRIRRHRACQP